MSNYSISFVKSSDSKNDVMNVDNIQDITNDNKSDNGDYIDSMIRFIGIQPYKDQTKLSLDIAFS